MSKAPRYIDEAAQRALVTDGRGVDQDPTRDRLAGQAREHVYGHCQSKFVYFAKTSEPDFVVIDFPAFFRVDLSGSMAAPSI